MRHMVLPMRARTVAPDPALEAVSGRRVDWCDAAGVRVSTRAGSSVWARACFDGASVPMRYFLVVGWAVRLLEGSPRSDAQHIVGWPIVAQSPHTVLQRRSRLGILTTLIFTSDGDMVTFSSAMTFSTPVARIVWAGVAPIHRWAVRSVLTHAAKTVGHA